MKMSDAMSALCYGALPFGPALIAEERERERREENLRRFRKADTVQVSVSRSLEGAGDEIEIYLEVLDYRPADKRHYHGCEYFPGYAEFGQAWTVKGEPFVFTDIERAAAEAQAIRKMFPQ